MSPGRLLTAATILLVVAGVVVILLTGRDSGLRVQAEFSSISGLVEGNEVRVQGAPAGTVERIELTDRNTALATLRLDEEVQPLRADATATVRPVDLLGDVYLALSPGRDRQPLRGSIRPARTSNAPRLSDLLSTFRPSVRQGLEAVLVELGSGLEQRGIDISRTATRLRPALQATDELMTELGSQRAGLRDLIADAQRTTRQLASRDRELGGLVDGMATTLNTTAERSTSLDRGLEAMPGLLIRLGRTSRQLSATARSATPLARSLRTIAPSLTRTTRTLGPFLDETRRAIKPTRPLVRRLHALLSSGRLTFQRLGTGLQALGRTAPDLRSLVDALVPAAAPISDGFFVNFADQAAEPGTQPFDPFADPARRYWRGAAVFSCEAFGVKIAPNCLDQFLDAPAPSGRDSSSPPKPAAPGRDRLPQLPQIPRLPRPPRPTLPDLPRLPPAVEGALNGVLGGDPAKKPEQLRDETRDLLDFLLGP